MILRRTLAALVFAAATLPVLAQNAAPTPPSTQAAPAKGAATPKPQVQQAPGGGPDKVWVNNKTNVYHCPSDRYYGKTKDGKYMTEPDAKKAGAHGARNETCFK